MPKHKTYGQFMSYSKRNNFIKNFYKNWGLKTENCLQRIKENLY